LRSLAYRTSSPSLPSSSVFSPSFVSFAACLID
jgi:hypothetical protein